MLFASYPRVAVVLTLLLWVAWLTYPAAAQTAEPAGVDAPAVASAPAADQPDPTAPPAPQAQTPAQRYRWWVIAPAVAAILLAIAVRQVVPALIVGILVGSFMMVPCLPTAEAYGAADGGALTTAVTAVRAATEKYLLGALVDSDHMKVVVFTLTIGFVVGVMGRSGGTSGLVALVAGATRSRRRTGLAAWFSGLVVFFDDYANAMIIGPTMRPVFDRMKMSRAKLAYIVDSTAAPVASIALIGTWVGAEVGFIADGFTNYAKDGSTVPAFLAGTSAMTAFVQSIPYRFYPILSLLLVFLVCLTGRDFGPMLKAERRALRGEGTPDQADPQNPHQPADGAPRWWLGAVPVLTLVVVTLTVLVATGLAADDTVAARAEASWAGISIFGKASMLLSNADSYVSILYGAISGATVAVILSVAARAVSLKFAFEAGMEGMARMLPAVVILILAWSLSAVTTDLQLGAVVADKLDHADFPARWLPFVVFIAAAFVSFSTGTSWGTMGILCPIVVQVAINRIGDVPPEQFASAQSLFYAAVAAVLSGAVFGDHCSPISDTTVLSSIASGCPHEEHVWTQLPYALVTAAVAMLLGDMMCSVLDLAWEWGFVASTLAIVAVVFGLGRRVDGPEAKMRAA
jgi:Na+/H+ antiporter NhaC